MLPEGAAGDLCSKGAVFLKEGSSASVDHVVGAITWPSEERVLGVMVERGQLVVRGETAERRVPFDEQFLVVTRT
jgi:hypothetical protein